MKKFGIVAVAVMIMLFSASVGSAKATNWQLSMYGEFDGYGLDVQLGEPLDVFALPWYSGEGNFTDTWLYPEDVAKKYRSMEWEQSHFVGKAIVGDVFLTIVHAGFSSGRLYIVIDGHKKLIGYLTPSDWVLVLLGGCGA